MRRQIDNTRFPNWTAAGRLQPFIWPALGLLALLLAFAAGSLRSRVPAEGSPEAVFARDMSAHHDQAVEMALILRDRTADEELRTMSLDIILTQQGQIGQMQGWLATWGLPSAKGTPMEGHGEMMGMATQAQVNELRTLPLPAAEVAFLQLMIRHHEGGVAMAEDALDQARRSEVLRLAGAIVQAQQSEIAYMQDLLRDRGAAPAAPSQPGEHGAH